MPWNAAKSKVQLRLSIQRLRMLQQKKEAQAKATRRDIATLLERSKVETARVKVEAIINEDIHVELLELLELYCELLLARFGLLDQNGPEPDPGISEGVCSIIHAAPRTELKELHVLRDLLMHKYGREFSLAVMENRDGCVSDRVVRKLDMSTPSPELVDAYLTEIARAYNVEWAATRKSGQDDGPDGGFKVQEPVTNAEKSTSQSNDEKEINEFAAKPTTTPPIDGNPQDSKNGNPSSQTNSLKGSTASPSAPEPINENDFEALTRRFAALKKR